MINLNIISVDLRKGFPSSSSGQEFACNARNLGLTPGSGRSSAGGCDVQGQGQKLGGPHAQRVVAKRSYPASEARGGGQEEQPHIQGAVAVRAREGLEELSHVEGQEGRW